MKKYSIFGWLFCMVTALAFSLTGCGKDNEPSSDEAPPPAPVVKFELSPVKVVVDAKGGSFKVTVNSSQSYSISST